MTAYDVGLLILRLVLGLTLAAHGYNKFFGGGRIPGTAGWFESIGMKYGKFQAVVAASTEISAGLGLAAGLLTPIPAAGFVALMFVAAWTVHRHNGFFIVKEGWEYNLILAVAAVAVATTGAGTVQPGLADLRATTGTTAGTDCSAHCCWAWAERSASWCCSTAAGHPG